MIVEEIEGLSGGGDGGDSGNNGGGFRPPSPWLRFDLGNGPVGRCNPPAFLTKTFTIVNDPNTNSIVSWSSSGTSFIIWDHLRFTTDIIRLYFNHSNLSSFTNQLSNYGFRKIGVTHQWEYENPNFQAGKQHLLTNIRRRNQDPHRTIIRRRKAHHDSNKNCSETLKIEIDKSKLEIQELKRQQSDMELQTGAFEAKVENIEKNSQKLIMIWSKACDRVLGRNFETGKEQGEDGEASKKRKLDIALEEKIEPSDDPVQEGNVECGPAGLGENSGVYMYWKKMLLGEDDEECGNGGGAELANRTAGIEMDLEHTIGKIAE